MVTHRPTKFGGHKNCCIGDIMVLVCHVIMTRDTIRWSPSMLAIILQSFVVIDTLVVEI